VPIAHCSGLLWLVGDAYPPTGEDAEIAYPAWGIQIVANGEFKLSLTGVPFYVISSWIRGGWVNSQVFDHTSVGQFLEKRFGVAIPAISPWHRAVCGDPTSAFDFESPNEMAFPSCRRSAIPPR
jgi:phospholipase C